MKKRHGIDELSIALVWLSVGLLVINYFLEGSFLNILSTIVVFYAIFRTLSTNNLKRNSENYIFKVKFLNPLKRRIRKIKRKFSKDKTHKYIKCKSCGQELRIPKGKGKVIVKCPKCKTKQKVNS